MAIRIYSIFAVLTVSANNAANFQVLNPGRIKQIQLNVVADFDADAETYYIEISTFPVLQQSTGAQGPITSLRDFCASGAAGILTTGKNIVVPMDVPVGRGDLIYLNAFLTGTGSVLADALVHVQE